MSNIDNTQDVIDVRDVIAAYEEAEEAIEAEASGEGDETDLAVLGTLLSELKGNGGDEQWRGDWYPVTLIRDSYFKEYAQDLAEDLGLIPEEFSWPASYIDWDAAVRDLKMDYTTVEYDGVTYWYR